MYVESTDNIIMGICDAVHVGWSGGESWCSGTLIRYK